jgi:NAD(P)-dependent dehydrogenase (short-subunit alcohol dehydrogenase family)
MSRVEGKVASISGVPNGLLEPDDVSNQILHLVTEAGQYITGTTFMVDAGFTAR